jgi:hypothetical protein
MLYQLAEIEELLAEAPGLHVRFSAGFAADLEAGSVDPETALELPGYAARPLDPEPWWTLPAEEWIARQLARAACSRPEGCFAWLLRGSVAGRSADGEPLLTDVEVVGRLADSLLDDAERVWRQRFDAALTGAEAGQIMVAHA